jgi:hypothetical protein
MEHGWILPSRAKMELTRLLKVATTSDAYRPDKRPRPEPSLRAGRFMDPSLGERSCSEKTAASLGAAES